MNKPVFEHTSCNRCGGSGRYSFNLMHGSCCYGCSGTGYQLTKRGKAAQAFLNNLRSIPAEQFQPGDLIRIDGFAAGSFVEPTRWARVASVEFKKGAECGYVSQPDLDIVQINTEDKGGRSYNMCLFPGNTMRKGFTAEQKRKQVEQALAYQATLTKAGKQSKRATN